MDLSLYSPNPFITESSHDQILWHKSRYKNKDTNLLKGHTWEIKMNYEEYPCVKFKYWYLNFSEAMCASVIKQKQR